MYIRGQEAVAVRLGELDGAGAVQVVLEDLGQLGVALVVPGVDQSGVRTPVMTQSNSVGGKLSQSAGVGLMELEPFRLSLGI